MSIPASYSLWLAPKGALASRCQAEIRHFAANSNLPDAHPFNPHVTLLGLDPLPLDSVLETTSQLAAKLAPFTISSDRVSFGKIFHQCVYILCNETPELMQAGAAAREAFGVDPAAKYMPHLSLIYSDTDQATRERLAEEAQRRLFDGASPEGPLPEKGYLVDSIEVWYTPLDDKTMQSWKEVAKVPLGA